MIKKITLLLFACFFVSISFAQKAHEGHRECASMDNLEYRMQQDPTLEGRMAEIEAYTQNKIREMSQNRIDGDVITIPVVVHIIYNTAQENISDAQIQSQIDVLNEDFRRLNSDADNTWSQAADVQIEFCLATIDESGNATNGITRKSSTRTSWGTNDAMKSSAQGGTDAWDTSKYLNMWVCNIGGGILGYAQFPGGNPLTDGVVMSPQYFGSSAKGTGFYLSAPFDLGRTTTHEVGHFLNLRHIWGDGNCAFDDFVADTPTSDAPNFGCATGHVSCGSVDMVQNYMDYSNDGCMNLFTQGQADRMRVTLLPGGVRASLGASDQCGTPPDPTCDDGIQNGDEEGVDCGGSNCPACPEPTCDDGIQNGDEEGVDCGGSNCAPCETGCSENGVTLSLTLDNFPNETSWILTDASGTTVASGGTYGSEPDGSTITEEFCLPDGCYSFTINDSVGDGICCGFGNGSYSLTDASGNVIVTGGDFGSSETTDFCFGDTPEPTCEDGIQNGDEEGVDCGGTNCPACPDEPTCDDGIQNGDEEGVDCGGSNCAPCETECTENTVTLSLTFDNFPNETSWLVTDESGATVASGGTYGSEPDGSTLVEEICLPDGCYSFTINDSFGDGICCTFGNGSYTLTDASGNVIASGAEFDSSETTEFCVGEGTGPTCDDGIQNGDEEGVDCGGSNCEPCQIDQSVILNQAFFEAGFDGWIDGGSDCGYYRGPRSWEGLGSVYIRDNSGDRSSLTSPALDMTPYNQVELEFYFFAYSMEAGEEFIVSFFDGTEWVDVATFVSGISFDNNGFYVATVPVNVSDLTFAANSAFKFTNNASNNADLIYLDQITITGLTLSAGARIVDSTPRLLRTMRVGGGSFDALLYPNPVTNGILNINTFGADNAKYRITNLLGQTVQAGALNESSINVSSLRAGIYIFELNDGEEITTEKFVKQ